MATNAEYALTRKIDALENEKGSLPYRWMDANEPNWRNLSGTALWERAEKATLPEKKRINAEIAKIREERKALKEAERAARAERTAANKARKIAERGPTAECQICEGHFCLTNAGRMVHHGYERPGWGYIVGDCWGVGYNPFPATDRLEIYLDALNDEIPMMEAKLAELPKLTKITERREKSRGWGSRGRREYEDITFIKGESAAHLWGDAYSSLEWKLKSRLENLRREVTRTTARITKGKELA